MNFFFTLPLAYPIILYDIGFIHSKYVFSRKPAGRWILMPIHVIEHATLPELCLAYQVGLDAYLFVYLLLMLIFFWGG